MKQFAVYVHIPFCTVKCGYCDFNAYAGMDRMKPQYEAAVLAELTSWAGAIGERSVSSIGFGGGTPGEMPAESIATVVSRIVGLWPLAPGAEVGLEANPGTSNEDHLSGLREAGVTRISFGAQSFSADELRFLDRIHSPEAIGASVRAARAVGFQSVGLDLIYGLPGQSDAAWRMNLDSAIALQPDHISCYSLTVEEGTGLAARVEGGEIELPTPDASADLYETAAEMLDANGFEHYELSNWSKPGHRSRHNLAYWTDRPYLGVGAGAHGYLDGFRYENVAHPRSYIAACGNDLAARIDLDLRPGGAIAAVTPLERSVAIVDFIALRLRLVEGLELADFRQRFGVDLNDVAAPVISESLEAGLLDEQGGRIALTPRGRLLHGEFVARLMALVEQA